MAVLPKPPGGIIGGPIGGGGGGGGGQVVLRDIGSGGARAVGGMHPQIANLIALFHRKKLPNISRKGVNLDPGYQSYVPNPYAGIPGMENYQNGPLAGVGGHATYGPQQMTVRGTSDPWAGYPSRERAAAVQEAARQFNAGPKGRSRGGAGQGLGVSDYSDYLKRLLMERQGGNGGF